MSVRIPARPLANMYWAPPPMLQENRVRSVGDEELVSESPAMRAVIDMVQRVAPSDAYILITGENLETHDLTALLDQLYLLTQPGFTPIACDDR